jgi:hypothetical protein
MKLSKSARAELKLMNVAEKKKVVSATRTLLQARLIGPAFANLVGRNYK